MICKVCNEEGILNHALGKEFWYCRKCKIEIVDNPTIIKQPTDWPYGWINKPSTEAEVDYLSPPPNGNKQPSSVTDSATPPIKWSQLEFDFYYSPREEKTKEENNNIVLDSLAEKYEKLKQQIKNNEEYIPQVLRWYK